MVLVNEKDVDSSRRLCCTQKNHDATEKMTRMKRKIYFFYFTDKYWQSQETWKKRQTKQFSCASKVCKLVICVDNLKKMLHTTLKPFRGIKTLVFLCMYYQTNCSVTELHNKSMYGDVVWWGLEDARVDFLSEIWMDFLSDTKYGHWQLSSHKANSLSVHNRNAVLCVGSDTLVHLFYFLHYSTHFLSLSLQPSLSNKGKKCQKKESYIITS